MRPLRITGNSLKCQTMEYFFNNFPPWHYLHRLSDIRLGMGLCLHSTSPNFPPCDESPFLAFYLSNE